MVWESTFNSPAGWLVLTEKDGVLIRLSFSPSEESGTMTKETPLLRKAKKQLSEYFAGERKVFDLPLSPEGTPFQKKVWQALLKIPYGETASYQEIAETIGQEKAARAVGMANHRNPLPIFIPCHRVIGKNGALTGYAGGIAVKEFLLRLEQGGI